ncbi:hypothetical protein F3Y22_tig00112856pilonHSYRG00117 [Hibiscus syriacus]|uniref:Uncharacterized protein n=1 Tax=Hibiscus syriacus TaxID=106335 RepID=A0A6A2WTL9_HIBSY|nr:uncharacterized protein LOC120183944 [Hibiscus syriacus]KAE8664141.1 hypothetical protein F3Y22_tig00112856pilonHSYRG00117 [Hibiscus syriacus]
MSRFFPNRSNKSGDSGFLHGVVGEATSALNKVAGDVAAEVRSPGLVASHSGFIKPILSDAVYAAHGVATELRNAGTHVASEAISAAQMSPGVAGGVSPQGQHSELLSTASGLINQVSSDAFSAAQMSPGVSPQGQHSGLLGTASGLVKQVSSDAISAVQMSPGGSPQGQISGLLGTASGLVKQVSSDAISAAQMSPGGSPQGQLSGVVGTASGFVKQISSDAISAAQMSPGLSPQGQYSGLLGTTSVFIKQVSSDAISAAQMSPGGSPQGQISGVVGTASGFVKQISSDAISAAQMFPGGSPQGQLSGVVGTASGFVKQISSDAISAAQMSPGLSPQGQHSGLLGTASGFIKQVSSDAISAAQGVATEVQHAGMVGEPLSNIDRLVKQVSSEAITTVQNVPGVAASVGSGGVLNTASGFLKQVSSDAISAAQGVATEVQHAGAVGESLARIDNLVPSVIKQVSSDAISATQKVAGAAAGLASDVQNGGVLSTATGLIKDVSSQAISTAQGVVTDLKHGGAVQEETQKLKYLAFVQAAIVHMFFLFTDLFTKLKQNSGPLKPVLQTVETLVKTVIGPIFYKFFDVFYDLLEFADDKIGELVTMIDSLLPSVVKDVLSEDISVGRNALGLTVDTPATVVQTTLVPSTASGFLDRISSGAILAVEGVASQVQNSGLIPEQLQILKYMKYIKFFIQLQEAALRLVKFYFKVKKMLGPLEPVIDAIERVVISLYQKFFAKIVKSLVRWVLIKFFGVPAEVFDLIDKVGDLNKFADLSNLGNLSKFNALEKVGDLSRLGDSSKIDALVQNLPGVGGLATELTGAGVLSTASGFLKQASSNPLTGFQVAAGVQRAGALDSTTKIDGLISPFFKQATSVATSVGQIASGVASGAASDVQRTGLFSAPAGFIKQISSEAISTVQNASEVAQGLATTGVGSTATGFITQLASGPIAVTQRSQEVQQPVEAPSLAQTVFDIVEPTVEKCAVSVLQKLNRIPLFPQVAAVAVPTACFFTGVYNEVVATGAKKGYMVASFLPLVPTEKIAKVFSGGKYD